MFTNSSLKLKDNENSGLKVQLEVICNENSSGEKYCFHRDPKAYMFFILILKTSSLNFKTRPVESKLHLRFPVFNPNRFSSHPTPPHPTHSGQIVI